MIRIYMCKKNILQETKIPQPWEKYIINSSSKVFWEGYVSYQEGIQ